MMSYRKVGSGRRSSSSSSSSPLQLSHGHGVGACSSSSSSKGFRLNPRRFSVQRLRARFIYLFRLLSRWRSSYGRALQSLKTTLIFCCSTGLATNKNTKNRRRRTTSKSRRSSSSSSRGLMKGSSSSSSPIVRHSLQGDFSSSRMRSFGRTNSFYSEAIAECLEFIKRSSLPAPAAVEQKQLLPT